LLCHCSVLGFNSPIFCLLRHYTISSRFPLFHYLFLTALVCCRLQLSPLLQLFHCRPTIFQGFHYFIICLLRHKTISSRFPLFHYLFVTSLYYFLTVSIVLLPFCYIIALFSDSAISSSVSYATILTISSSIPLFHHLFFFLLRHKTLSRRIPLFHCFGLFITSLLCSRLQLSPLLFVASLHTLFQQGFHFSLSVCCFTALFSASIVPSSVRYVTILSPQGFHCLLRPCSVLGHSSLLFYLLRHYTISSRFL